MTIPGRVGVGMTKIDESWPVYLGTLIDCGWHKRFYSIVTFKRTCKKGFSKATCVLKCL